VTVHIEESFLLCYKTKLTAFQKKKKLTASHRLIIFTMHGSTARTSAAKRAILPSLYIRLLSPVDKEQQEKTIWKGFSENRFTSEEKKNKLASSSFYLPASSFLPCFAKRLHATAPRLVQNNRNWYKSSQMVSK